MLSPAFPFGGMEHPGAVFYNASGLLLDASATEGLVHNLVDRVLEVYREPAAEAAAPFGWRYTRHKVFDASAAVTPLAAPGSSIPVSRLLP